MVTRPVERVAVVGPNGTLGRSVITHLVRLNFSITLITRSSSRTTDNFPEISQTQIRETDYSSASDIAPLLHDQDAVVILISGQDDKTPLVVIDAAIQAGVRRIVPSSFGIGTKNEYTRNTPFAAAKVKQEDYIQDKARNDDGKWIFTAIQTGLFLDWALPKGVLINISGEGKTMLYDGGDTKLSTTVVDDIGLAVANCLKCEEALVANRFLYVQSCVVSQNLLLRLARELKPEAPWEIEDVDTKEWERKGKEMWDRGERSREVMIRWVARGTFGLGLGLFQKVDNDMLGIEEMGVEQIRAVLKKAIAQAAI